MDHQRIPQQAMYWQVPGYKRGPGRPRTNWRSTVNKEREEAEVAALDSHGWRRSVAQCVQLDAGWIKAKNAADKLHNYNSSLFRLLNCSQFCTKMTAIAIFDPDANLTPTHVQSRSSAVEKLSTVFRWNSNKARSSRNTLWVAVTVADNSTLPPPPL